MTNSKEYMRKWREKNSDKIRGYQKQYRKNNPDKTKEYSRQWRKNNLEKGRIYRKENQEKNKIYQKQWRENNSEYGSKYHKQWRRDNLEKERKYKREYRAMKRKTDFKFYFNDKTSKAIRLSLKGNKNGWHWETLVGYTLNELIKHLKETLPKGYTWNDYLAGKLHIDHIIPLSAFNFNKPEHPDFRRCWALENLQLLPARENLIKGSKLSKPFQPALKLSLDIPI